MYNVYLCVYICMYIYIYIYMYIYVHKQRFIHMLWLTCLELEWYAHRIIFYG